MNNENNKSGLENAKNITQEDIDKIKPKKTIKLASVLLTLLLIGIVVGPIGYFYYADKKEEERLAEEEANIKKQMEEIAKKKETEKEKKEEPVEKDYTYEIASYEENPSYSYRGVGNKETTKSATYKNEDITVLAEFTDNGMTIKLNDEIIYELTDNPGEMRVFNYNDYYVVEASIEGEQYPKRTTLIYDKTGKEMGKLENKEVASFYAEFSKEYITFFENDYPYPQVEGTCKSVKSDESKVNTTSKYKITNGKLTLLSSSKEYCKD